MVHDMIREMIYKNARRQWRRHFPKSQAVMAMRSEPISSSKVTAAHLWAPDISGSSTSKWMSLIFNRTTFSHYLEWDWWAQPCASSRWSYKVHQCQRRCTRRMDLRIAIQIEEGSAWLCHIFYADSASSWLTPSAIFPTLTWVCRSMMHTPNCACTCSYIKHSQD